MTVKNFHVDPNLGYGTINDVHGGVQLQIMANSELHNLMLWWRQWGPVFSNPNPTVTDALQQAKVLHDVTQA